MKRTSTTLILLTLAAATATLLAAERSTITYKGMAVRDPAPYGEAGAAWQNNFKALADRIGPCKFDATTAPTATDDSSSGYSTGSLWYDAVANRLYWCASAAEGAAVWIEVSPADLSQVYQPLNANLTTWAGVAPSANGQSLVAAADYPAMRGLLGLGTMATQAANSVAITGGAIDGTAIGATTPGTGSFTTLAATGKIDLPETTSRTVGVIKVGDLLIHGFRHPTGDTARPDGNNVFIGPSAGNFTMGAEATSKVHGSLNTGIGYLVLSSLTTGYSNVAIGDRALFAATEGSENMALGRLALGLITTGTRNVGIGYYAGRYTYGSGDNQTTSNSTYIGSSTRAFADGVTNETVIGYATTGKGSNTVQIGNNSVTDTYISGWLNLPSDTKGLKLDAAGTTTLISNGTTATLSKPLKAAGYQAADGSAGISQTIAIVDKVDVTHTLVFKDGLLTNYSTAP